MKFRSICVLLPLALLTATIARAQARVVSPIPLSAPEPTSPPASSFHDSRYGVSFQSPVGWTLTRRDSEVSTFNNDAHSAPASTRMRAVATIGFNPHPLG